MRELTTTKATYRGISISVSYERFEGKNMFYCEDSLGGSLKQEQWFATQGEAIANERHEVDRKMGPMLQ